MTGYASIIGEIAEKLKAALRKHSDPYGGEGAINVRPGSRVKVYDAITRLMTAYGSDRAFYEQGPRDMLVQATERIPDRSESTQAFTREPVFTADVALEQGAERGIVSRLTLTWKSDRPAPTAEDVMRVIAQR